jgi:hypothetical protein
MSTVSLRLKVQASSLNATILAVVTSIGGLIMGLGVITSAQDGLLVATTIAGIAAVGLIANAIHTGNIEPSALTTAIIAVVAQVVALAVSFLWITEATAQHVVVIVTAIVIAVAQIAHALLSRQVESTPPVDELLAEPVRELSGPARFMAVRARELTKAEHYQGKRLGATWSEPDSRNLQALDFVNLDAVLSRAPGTFTLPGLATLNANQAWLSMLGNGPASASDRLPAAWRAAFQGCGNCVWADAVRRALAAIVSAGKPLPPASAIDSLYMYGEVVGYDPVTGANDNGTNMATAMKYQHQVGILLGATANEKGVVTGGVRHKIGAYLELPQGVSLNILAALVWALDSVSLAITFDQAQMEQFNADKPWKPVKGSPLDGGHCIGGYERKVAGALEIDSWGRLLPADAALLVGPEKQLQQSFGIVMPDTLNGQDENDRGLKVAALESALREVTA